MVILTKKQFNVMIERKKSIFHRLLVRNNVHGKSTQTRVIKQFVQGRYGEGVLFDKRDNIQNIH